MNELNQTSEKLLKSLSFCVIDLETTGGNQNYDKIIEIGLVKIDQLNIVDEKNILIDPEIPIPDFIQKLTSIKEKDIEGGGGLGDSSSIESANGLNGGGGEGKGSLNSGSSASSSKSEAISYLKRVPSGFKAIERFRCVLSLPTWSI